MNTPEKAADKIVAPTKDSWTSTLFRWLSQIFVFWVGVLVVQIIFSVQATWMFNTKTKQEEDSDTLIYKVKPEAVTFHVDDVSEFKPETAAVTDVRSDRTTHDLLQGKYGAVVVLLQAEWCVHCKNMMNEYTIAAKTAKVPFVRVEGQYIRQTAKHFKVEGFPTIFGVDASGKLLKFASHRVASEFLDFSKKLVEIKDLAATNVAAQATEPEKLASDLPAVPEDQTDTGAEESVSGTVAQTKTSIEVLDEEPAKEPIPEDSL